MNRERINSKNHTEWEHLIYEWVHDELDRKILARCLLDGITVEKVAGEINLSTVQCHRRFKRAEAQLFNHI